MPLALRRFFAAAFGFFLLASPLAAQTVTGTLQGTVADATGAVLPGARVTAHNTETGLERAVTTNSEGFYSAPFLPIGPYRITAALSGFGSRAKTVDITLNFTRVVDFSLSPTVSEQVVVTSERPPINTTNGTIQHSLSSEEILDKPTAAPNSFLGLAEIFAGFQENPTSGQNNPTASSGSSINFNGTGTRGATFQIDGVNNDDASENQHRQGVSLSTVKEFQIITNTFTAEFGRGYGAVVLVQTKSGTNQVHGDLYEFHTDSDLASRSYFARLAGSPKPVNHRNQYGGTLGFPILKGQLFGFVSADHTRRKGEGSYTRDLFTPAELAAPRLTRGNDTPANRAFIEDILRRYPSSLTPNDPRSPRTYSGTVGFDQPLDDFTGRLDWEPRPSDHVVARWQYTRQIFDNEDIIIGEATKQNNKQQNGGLTWTHVFSSNTVGEFRYGLGLRATHVDIKASNETPVVRFVASPVSGSIIGNAGNFPIHRDQTDHQFVYNISTFLGASHILKAGADVRRSRLDDLAENFDRGFWNVNRVCSGVTYDTAYAAFLDGCVATFQKAWGPSFLENRINEYNLYAEDNWRLRPNLTLDLGVRYEYAGAPSEKEGRIDYSFGDDKDNVEPRVGFAWVPQAKGGLLGKLTGGTGNASIRGGYGLYHGRVFQSIFSQGGASVRSNPPNALSRVLTNSLNLADPTDGFVFVPGPQTARHMLTIVDPGLEMPYTHQWSLTFERKMPWSSTLRLSYTGNHGVGFLQYEFENLPVSPLAGGIVVVDHPNNAPAAGFPDLRGIKIDRIADDVQCAGTGLPGIPVSAQCPVPVPIANNEVSFRVPRTNERRPDPRYSSNLVVSNGATTDYHGLQLEWVKKLSHGLQFQASYTWSKAIDDGSEATAVGAGDTNIFSRNRSFVRGLSRFHTPHRFTFNGSYLLPILRNRTDLAGRLLGGWQLAAFVKIAHGTPFTVTDTTPGGDLDFDGVVENRPVLLDDSVLGRTINDPANSQQQLPASAFRHALPGDLGKNIVGRNVFYGDGVKNVDLGLYKSFRMPMDHRLSLRLEVYNLFNRTQFAFPTADLASVNFGRLLSQQNGPRFVQLAVRYQF
jgi:outer membrane receptor protein involved in Fe transport